MASKNQKQSLDIRQLEIIIAPTDTVTPSHRASRLKTEKHLAELDRSFDEFGMIDPLLVDENHEIIAGEARFAVAKARRMTEIPIIVLPHLNEAQKVALREAHNRLCEKGEWDQEKLAANFEFLIEHEYEFDLEVTGFEFAEIDIILQGGTEAVKANAKAAAENAEDIELPDIPDVPVSREGDLFRIGDHVVICGDATNEIAYRKGLGDREADLGLTDSPYNISANRISGLGKTKHANFVQGSGEMSSDQFRAFVGAAAMQMHAHCRAGSYNMFFTAWYSLPDIMAGCDRAFGKLAHICIWAKTNGGMGSPWRNAWEGILVYRKKGGKVQNNVQLGRFGRNRTDVFQYAGVNVFRKGRMEELRSHPTCKPVELLKDIILDVTPIDGIVLDPFLGSGSSIIAAHEARRRCVGIELDPCYVDVAIRRIEKATGLEAVHETGRTFSQLSHDRVKEDE